MKKFNCIFSVVIFVLLFLSSSSLFAQCPGDTFGNCDTLFVEKTPQGRIFPNSEFVVWVWGYHDENLAGISIPIRFKTNQMDVTLDSGYNKRYSW